MAVVIAAERIRDLLCALFEQVPGAGFRDRPAADGRIFLVDHAYSPVSAAEIRRAAAALPLPPPAAAGGDERSDCDDYALQLKAALAARRRRGVPRPPPAIGIVVAEIHAVSAFVSATAAGLRLFLCDASRPGLPRATRPADIPALLLDKPAIRFVYF